MVDSLQAYDLRLEASVVVMYVIEKVQLGRRRAGDQDLVRIGEGKGELSKKTMLVIRSLLVTVLIGFFTFGVSVDMPMRGLDDLFGKTVCAHLKNTCFAMIKPYRHAMEFHEIFLCEITRETRAQARFELELFAASESLK
jgi:hypothetical protein